MTDGNLPTAADLPRTMTERPQWVCWRSQERNGKQTKIPINPETNAYASATDSETWKAFDTARGTAEADGLGLGFVFTASDSLVGVDLDDCRDTATGALDADARAIVSQLDSYTEVSPSGSGVHVIVEGDLPAGRNRHGTVELYDDARFFTVTGSHLSETPTSVEHRPDELAAVHGEYVAVEDTATGSDSPPPATGDRENSLTDSELLDRACAATNGEKFTRLFDGSTAGYPSQSEADMALCSLLAFWTGGDETQMDRLFRESGLFRGKWDEVHFGDGATYGERTIERAVAGTSEFYEPPAPDSWTAFGTDESVTRHNETTMGDDTPREPTPISTDVLASVRTELDALEAENERLRKALSAEREQRHELEVVLEEEKEQKLGILGRLFRSR